MSQFGVQQRLKPLQRRQQQSRAQFFGGFRGVGGGQFTDGSGIFYDQGGLEQMYAAGGNNLPNQLTDIGLGDAMAVDAAEGERYQNAQQGIAQFEKFVGNLGNRGGAIADRAVRPYSQVELQGGDFAAFDASAEDAIGAQQQAVATGNENVRAVTQGVADARSSAVSATQQAGRAADQFAEGANERLGAIVARVDQQIQQETRRINSGLNPDGTLMTPEQRAAARAQVAAQASTAAAGVYAQAAGEVESTLAGLRQNAANFQTRVTDTVLAGNEQISRAREGLAGQQSREAELRAGLASTRLGLSVQDASQLNQNRVAMAGAEASLRSSIEMRAMELEAQGRSDLAAMYRDHKRSPVTMLGMFTQLAAVQSAPGAGSAQEVQL